MNIFKKIERCPNFNDHEKYEIISHLVEIGTSLELRSRCLFDENAKCLDDCMLWDNTPQGFKYWENMSYIFLYGNKIKQNKKEFNSNLELKKLQELEEME